MVTPQLKYIPIEIFSCPVCSSRKKPYGSLMKLNVHLSRKHPEWEYKIVLREGQAYTERKKLTKIG